MRQIVIFLFYHTTHLHAYPLGWCKGKIGEWGYRIPDGGEVKISDVYLDTISNN